MQNALSPHVLVFDSLEFAVLLISIAEGDALIRLD